MPRVYLINEQAPNAFATGPQPRKRGGWRHHRHFAGAQRRELRGVMAHELAHVKNRDILISTISATMAGCHFHAGQLRLMLGGRDSEGRPVNPIVSILVMFWPPLAASVDSNGISRSREFEADRGGAEISGDPAALASALQKIQRVAQGVPLEAAEQHPETAANDDHEPVVGGGLRGLFSTHPATESGSSACWPWRRAWGAERRYCRHELLQGRAHRALKRQRCVADKTSEAPSRCRVLRLSCSPPCVHLSCRLLCWPPP